MPWVGRTAMASQKTLRARDRYGSVSERLTGISSVVQRQWEVFFISLPITPRSGSSTPLLWGHGSATVLGGPHANNDNTNK